jgi:hypothetical protein
MPSKSLTRLFLISAVAGSLMATPALAQGKGNSKNQDRRGADRPELIRRGDTWEQQQRRGSGKQNAQNAPAFCRSGAGHPVHGRRWCEERGWGVYNQGRYDSRNTTRNDRYEVNDRNRRGATNYETAHAEFHRQHDRQCRARAAERPLDLQYQVRVRNECRQRHEDWHYRAGRAH